MYAIEHNGMAIGPSGLITDTEGTPLDAKNIPAFNAELARQEMERIKTHPERLFLYVRHPQKDVNAPDAPLGMTKYGQPEYRYSITTWPGKVVAQGVNCWVGARCRVGFGFHTYRRPVSARIFGVLYHGWYYESSGDYCRLKKAKRQHGKWL